MALAHNLLLRVLNSIYLQCTTPTLPTDIQDLLIYAQSWLDAIHHHHSCEETFFFPEIEAYTGEKGIMEKNVSQHEAFHPGLEEFKKYVYETKIEDYDGRKLRTIIDGFGNILMTHLNDEIETLMELERFGGERLAEAWAQLEIKVQKSVQNRVCIPRCCWIWNDC
jgi:hemerythrin-like domain-containing protein